MEKFEIELYNLDSVLVGLAEYHKSPKQLNQTFDWVLSEALYNCSEFAEMLIWDERKIAKSQVRKFWSEQDFDLQLKDYQSNCTLCFQKGKQIRLTILSENPEIAQWWANWETQKGHKWNKDFSVLELLNWAQAGNFTRVKDSLEQDANILQLFDPEPAVGCFCGD